MHKSGVGCRVEGAYTRTSFCRARLGFLMGPRFSARPGRSFASPDPSSDPDRVRATPSGPSTSEAIRSKNGSLTCTGGPGVIQKEAWPFYRAISGVRLCWELEEPEGPKGPPPSSSTAPSPSASSRPTSYRGTSLIRNRRPPRTTGGP